MYVHQEEEDEVEVHAYARSEKVTRKLLEKYERRIPISRPHNN
jgi:hypothetical protein